MKKVVKTCGIVCSMLSPATQNLTITILFHEKKRIKTCEIVFFMLSPATISQNFQIATTCHRTYFALIKEFWIFTYFLLCSFLSRYHLDSLTISKLSPKLTLAWPLNAVVTDPGALYILVMTVLWVEPSAELVIVALLSTVMTCHDY